MADDSEEKKSSYMYKVLLSIIHLSYSFIFNIISLKLSYRDVFCYTEHLLFTCRNIHDLVTLYLSEYVQYVLKTYADAFLFFFLCNFRDTQQHFLFTYP